MLFLLLLACTGVPKDTGLGFDQPGIDDPTARTWNRAGSWYPLDPDELDAEIAGLLGDVNAGAPALALWTEGPWLVPGHALEVDAELTEALQAGPAGSHPGSRGFREPSR